MNAQDYLKALADARIPVKLFNQNYNEYLFVSNDKKGPDNVVETHGSQFVNEPRNSFVLEHVGNNRFRIYNPTYQRWLFVSNDKIKGDNVVEAHPHPGEPRNEFEFSPVGSDYRRFKIFNPTFGRWMFVSNDEIKGDNVVEAHPQEGEDRNIFDLVVAPVASYRLEDVTYDLARARRGERVVPGRSAGNVSMRNAGGTRAEMTVPMRASFTRQYRWTTDWAVQDNLRMNIRARVPFMAESGPALTGEQDFESMHCGLVTQSLQYSEEIKSVLEPYSEVVLRWELEQYWITVPFQAKLVLRIGGGSMKLPVSGTFEGLGDPKPRVEFVESRPVPAPRPIGKKPIRKPIKQIHR